MELKEQVESLQKDIAQLTTLMTEKAQKDQGVDVKELSDKLEEVQKELKERKLQFEAAKPAAAGQISKEAQKRADELFIAKTLCVNKDTGAFLEHKFEQLLAMPEYKNAVDEIKSIATVQGVGTSNQTNITGVNTSGAWVPAGFSAQLQEEIWLALEVAGLFGRINMPAPTFNLPFNPNRIVAQATLEGQDVTKTLVADAKITFTANKLMSIIELTDELEQDAIFPVLDMLRSQLIGGFAVAQDTMALNGEKSTHGNKIYSSSLAASDARGLVNGIRAIAAESASTYIAQTNNTGDAIVTSIRAMRAAMGKYGKNPADLAIILSIADYNLLLNATAYQPLYSYGAGAVILTGELGRVDNIPIIVTELCPQKTATDSATTGIAGGLNAAGIYDGTTKTKGAITLVNKNGFKWGDRKEFGLELFRNPFNQTLNLVGSQRLDFEKVLSASATPVACGYSL